MLNPTGGNRKYRSLIPYLEIVLILVTVGGKCGFVWGGTALFTLIVAYFCLPEMKGRSYREIDILFRRRVSARRFKSTDINIEDDE
jgi:hypothetical protein